jgi:mannosyltransferase
MAEKLEIIVDGIIYQTQAKGGVSRLFSEILPRMCDLDDLLYITLLTQGQFKQPLPIHSHITHRSVRNIERYLRPVRIWKPLIPAVNKLVRKLTFGRGTGKIWHSTYFTMPQGWNGYSVVTVHDMIFERFRDFYSGPDAEQFRERKRQCICDADAVICVSEATREDVRNFYKLDFNSIYAVPNACSDVFKQLEQDVDIPMPLTNQPFLL